MGEMKRNSQSVDLLQALGMLALDPGGRYGDYVRWFAERFDCRERAAKDAIAVLVSAGYLERQTDAADGRVRRYWPTKRAQLLLREPRAGFILAYARRLFSTCREPSALDFAERCERLERAETLLITALPFELSGDLSAGARWADQLPLPDVATDHSAEPLQFFIHESRCKVCRSPLRSEIDRRVAAGESQAAVRRHANSLVGSEYFSANNISRHIRNHFREHTPELREMLQQRLQDHRRQRAATIARLNEIIQIGLAAIHAGVTRPTPGDLLRIIDYREDRRAANRERAAEYETVVAEFGMFVEAVREVAGEELFAQILAGYAVRSAEGKLAHEYEARRRLIEPSFSLA